VIRAHFGTGTHPALPSSLAAFANALEDAAGDAAAPLIARYHPLIEADRPLTAVRLDGDGPIAATAEAYLKLHLLSHRLALPNTLNLEGIFEHLPTVAWTSRGAVDPAELEPLLLTARLAGEHVEVSGVDKFPRMTNYVVPSGVRIADASRIRLGAYLGEGTTVMHEGFVNFNAGALGPSMLEGRVSQGVVVGAHSDLGGGSSTMGTLSGGGGLRISIGNNCLIGANGGTGIPLGDRCTIEAGLYITAGTRVTVVDETGSVVKSTKARELAGASDLLFIRTCETGQIQCRTNRRAIELNEALHAHN
jgi:2,3,4,5-tetrahydropyridine-2-carboxylate N-succinyltransferase